MRALVAAITAATFLANASLAEAAEGPTTPVAGYCVWSPDPVLTELSVLLDDADCASLNAIPTDPRIEITVARTPIFKGERAFGKPSLVHEQTAFVIYADPYAERIAPLSFVKEQYRSFKDAMKSYDEFAGSIGDRVGQFHASYMTIGPRWAKDADAALVSALVRMNINAAALGPSFVLYPGAVIEAPGHILSGASRTKKGIESGRYDEAALGVAEVCGGVGVLASLAAPIAKGLSVRVTPVSLGAATRTAAAFDAIAINAESPVVLVNPAKIRWSQRTAGGSGRTAIVRERIQNLGYIEDPIDVVQTPDGFVTLDHTRAAVALERGITEIRARVHQVSDPLPPEMTRITRTMIENGEGPRFGNSKTWGEALEHRIAKQKPRLDPTGTTTPPKLMGPRKTTKAE